MVSKKSKLPLPCKSPPMINMAPAGFEPGPITRSFILCPGNIEYYLADLLAPIFHDLGLSPNAVTLINAFVIRAYAIYIFVYLRWFQVFLPLHTFSGILDCTDGQIARRYLLGSDFGAKLDHATDNLYAIALVLAILHNISVNFGVASVQFGLFSVFSILIALLGNCAMIVKEKAIRWKDLTILQTLGVVQEWYMSYITIFILQFLIFTKTIRWNTRLSSVRYNTSFQSLATWST